MPTSTMLQTFTVVASQSPNAVTAPQLPTVATQAATGPQGPQGALPVYNLGTYVDLTGAQDGTTGLQTLLTLIQNGTTGGRILSGPGTLKINGSVSYTSGNPLDWDGASALTIDGTASTATTLITLGGQRLTSAALAANVSAGSLTISSALSGVNPGDVLLISNDAYCIANDPGTYAGRVSDGAWFSGTSGVYYRGEFVEVASVAAGSPNVFTLKSPLKDSYVATPVTKATIYRLQLPKVSVKNLTITRNSNQAALTIQYARDMKLSGCKASGARERLFNLLYCYGGSVLNNSGTDYWYSGTGTSYGIAIGTCKKLLVSGNRFDGGRHALTLGGWEPNRDILVSGNFFDNYKDSSVAVPCLGSHDNADHCTFKDNFCGDGILYTGVNSHIVGNEIVICQQTTGIQWTPGPASCQFMELKDNTVRALTPNSNVTYGIYCSLYQSGQSFSCDNLIVEGNKAEDGSLYHGFLLGPTISSTQITIRLVELLNNKFKTQQQALEVLTAGGLTGTRLDLELVRIRGGELYALGTGSVAGRAILYAGTTYSLEDILLEGVHCRCDFAGSSADNVLAITGQHDLTMLNCYLEGNRDLSLAAAQAIISCPGNIRLKANKLFSLKNGGLQLSNASCSIWLEDNDFNSVSGTPTYAGTIVFQRDSSGNMARSSTGTTTVTADTGAGTSPAISLVGNTPTNGYKQSDDQNGQISLRTGTAPASSSRVCYVTFANALTAAPKLISLCALNPAAQGIISHLYVNTASGQTAATAGFDVYADSTGLPGSGGPYLIGYHVDG